MHTRPRRTSYGRRDKANSWIANILAYGAVILVVLPGVAAVFIGLFAVVRGYSLATISVLNPSQSSVGWLLSLWFPIAGALVVGAGVFIAILLMVGGDKASGSAQRGAAIVSGVIAVALVLLAVSFDLNMVRIADRRQAFDVIAAGLPDSTRLKSLEASPTARPSLPMVAFVRDVSDGPNGRLVYREDWALPEGPAPRSPQETRAILVVERSARVVRTYRPAGSDLQVEAGVFLLSWPDLALLAKERLLGRAPSDRSGAPGGLSNIESGPEPKEEAWTWVRAQLR